MRREKGAKAAYMMSGLFSGSPQHVSICKLKFVLYLL